MRRIHAVLAISGFRRLWTSAYLCCVGDWLALFALSSLVTKLTAGLSAQAFAFSGVVATQLLPGLLLAPVAGILADRVDRRTVLIACDLLRCALFLSIALVGTTWWLFIANFLVGCCSTIWIPAKDSLVPNLLRDSRQLEAANQLTVVTTYGLACLTGTGLFAVISAFFGNSEGATISSVVVILNGVLYLSSALVLTAGLPYGGVNSPRTNRKTEPVSAMLLDGIKFGFCSQLIRGLIIGITGAVAAAGALISAARPYAELLQGGETGFSLLFIAIVLGVFAGIVTMPLLARRITHNRLFGAVIATSGVALLIIACTSMLWVALLAVACVGFGAGIAFLVAITIIGSQVDDAMRGRTNAFVQILVKVLLFGATVLVPQAIVLGGDVAMVRVIFFVAAIVCVGAGLLAQLHMTKGRMPGRYATERAEAVRPADKADLVEVR